jgi:hypothetical protein
MAGTSSTTHQASATTAFSSRRVNVALFAWVVLILTLYVAVLTVIQAGQHVQAPSGPTQEFLQQDHQSTEPIYFPGRPY